MKNFFAGFFGMAFALIVIAGLPIGGAWLARHFGYDGELGVMVGFALLVCIVVGLICLDDDEVKYKYKVQIGDKEFKCNTVSHTEAVESILLTMDGVESRLAIGTNILISEK